jgi:hypothetical protein
MYVRKILARGIMLITGSEFLHCPRPEPGWIRIYMGKRSILVRLSHHLRSFYLWFNFTPGTKIACSLILKLAASALT